MQLLTVIESTRKAICAILKYLALPTRAAPLATAEPEPTPGDLGFFGLPILEM